MQFQNQTKRNEVKNKKKCLGSFQRSMDRNSRVGMPSTYVRNNRKRDEMVRELLHRAHCIYSFQSVG